MKSTLTTLQAIWVAIGSFLMVTGITSKVPWLTQLFSQGFVDAVVTAAGAVVTFYQFVRAIFAATNTGAKESTSLIGYFLNPFKLAS